MTTKDEALRIALKKAFDLGKRYWSWADSEYSSHWKKADVAKEQFDQLIDDTIREVLAQPEHEPVAWLCMTDQYSKIVRFEWETFGNVTPLYTTPPHRKPLTDKEIGEIAGETLDPWSCARAIEAAHGIKGSE